MMIPDSSLGIIISIVGLLAVPAFLAATLLYLEYVADVTSGRFTASARESGNDGLATTQRSQPSVEFTGSCLLVVGGLAVLSVAGALGEASILRRAGYALGVVGFSSLAALTAHSLIWAVFEVCLGRDTLTRIWWRLFPE